MMHSSPCITSLASQHPKKLLIFTTSWPPLFFALPHQALQTCPPPHPLYSLRSRKNLKPCLLAGFRDNIHISHYIACVRYRCIEFWRFFSQEIVCFLPSGCTLQVHVVSHPPVTRRTREKSWMLNARLLTRTCLEDLRRGTVCALFRLFRIKATIEMNDVLNIKCLLHYIVAALATLRCLKPDGASELRTAAHWSCR